MSEPKIVYPAVQSYGGHSHAAHLPVARPAENFAAATVIAGAEGKDNAEVVVKNTPAPAPATPAPQ